MQLDYFRYQYNKTYMLARNILTIWPKSCPSKDGDSFINIEEVENLNSKLSVTESSASSDSEESGN